MLNIGLIGLDLEINHRLLKINGKDIFKIYFSYVSN